MYLPWTVCGRQLHWTEAVLLFWISLSIFLTIAWSMKVTMDAFVYSVFLLPAALISLVFVWGVANIKSFAKLADALEQEQERIDSVTEVLRTENNRIHELTNQTKDKMKTMAQDMGLFEDGLEDLDTVTEALAEFNSTMMENIHEKQLLDQAQHEKIIRQQEVQRDERARQTHDEIMEWFDATSDRGTQIRDQGKIQELLEILGKSALMKELEREGKDWRQRILSSLSPDRGVLEKWALMDAFHELAQTEYYEITKAKEKSIGLLEKRNRLAEQLRKARGE